MKEHIAVPIRLRAKVGVIDQGPPELQGKWAFTVWLTDINGSNQNEIGTYGPFDSKQIAEKESRRRTAEMAKVASEVVAGEGKGSPMLYDMKNGGKLRNPIDFIERG